MRQSVPDHRLLSQAELRLRIKNPTMDQEQRLELYRGTGDQARYLGTRFVSKDLSNRWLSFDVKQTMIEWLQGSGKVNAGIQLTSAVVSQLQLMSVFEMCSYKNVFPNYVPHNLLG